MALSLKRPARFEARSPRAGVTIPACLLLADDRVLDVTVRNVSAQGLMAECDQPLPKGTWLGVDLPGFGIARAVVRWSEQGEVGCSFRDPLDIERFSMAAMAGAKSGSLFAGSGHATR